MNKTIARILITGFEPFDGQSLNASMQAVRRLPAHVTSLELITVELPTSFARSLPALEAAIVRSQPQFVLCVGEAHTRSVLSVERVAINLQDARIADNDGAQPLDTPVVAGGPGAYFSTLPVKGMVEALLAARLPAGISNSAGTFVCNHVFYGLLHWAATQRYRFRGGVLHVPRLPEQVHASEPYMTLDDIVRGILVVLEVIAVADAASG